VIVFKKSKENTQDLHQSIYCFSNFCCNITMVFCENNLELDQNKNFKSDAIGF